MASAPTTRVSAGEYLDHHGHHRPPSPTSSLSPTLVNDTRTPLKLTFPCGSSNILNSVVVDTAGQTLYAISSNSKRTTLVSCRDNVEIATVQWDRSSPRMVFRQKRIKCKAWLPLSGPEDGSRTLTHGDAQFTWTQGSASGHLTPVNRPGLAVARYVKSSTDELVLDIFQETEVESGLVEAIVLSVVLLRSGQSLGDSPGDLFGSSNPKYFAGYSNQGSLTF